MADVLMRQFGRRYGKFTISRKLLFSDPALVRKILAQTIVVKCESIFACYGFEYLAISSHFDEVEQGAIIPEYGVIIHRERDRVKWLFWPIEET